MTFEQYADHALAATVIFTHRTFTESLSLFALLTARFDVRPPQNIVSAGGASLQKWNEQVQAPVRIRVSNVLRQWVALCPEDFNASELSAAFTSFVDGPLMSATPTMAAHLRAFFQKRHDRAREAVSAQIGTMGRTPPKALLSRKLLSGGTIEFGDIKPQELARQCCLIDQAIFVAIRPHECLGRMWLKNSTKVQSPNVVALTDRFNALSAFVRTSIVQASKQKPRAELIKRWVKVAHHLRLLNNFHSLLAVLSGLESAPVHRLRATWPHVNRKALARLTDLRQALNAKGGHKILRDLVRCADPPLLPYLGISLGDLVAVEESQPDTLDALINVRKRRLLGDVIRELQRHQATRYCFADAPPVRDFIQDLSARILDEDECYRLSCQIEPRDRREPVSRSANLQRLLASNPALQSEVTKELRVTMRRSTQPDKDRPPSIPPHVLPLALAPAPTSAATAVENAAQSVTTPAAALALAREWCRYAKGDESWRVLLTTRAVPLLLLNSVYLAQDLPITLVNELFAANILLSDVSGRMLSELAVAWKGRPRDDDLYASLSPLLSAFCAVPPTLELIAELKSLTTETERAAVAERECAETTSLPADEVRQLAALRAHLESAAAAVATEQGLYDALVTHCATLGPPPRVYARTTEDLHSPALRALHERVLSGTCTDPARTTGYWAALAFASSVEPALQAFFTAEERAFQCQCRAALRRILGLLEAHVATLVRLVRTLQLRLLSRRSSNESAELDSAEQQDATALAVLLGRVDEAEEVATEVLDGLSQLGASTEEKETCVFSDLVTLRALERALEEELPHLFAEDHVSNSSANSSGGGSDSGTSMPLPSPSFAQLPLGLLSSSYTQLPSGMMSPGSPVRTSNPTIIPAPASFTPLTSNTTPVAPALNKSSSASGLSFLSSYSSSLTSSSTNNATLPPPPSLPPAPSPLTSNSSDIPVSSSFPSGPGTSSLAPAQHELAGTPPSMAAITVSRDSPGSPRTGREGRARTVARRPQVDQLLQQIDSLLASTAPALDRPLP